MQASDLPQTSLESRTLLRFPIDGVPRSPNRPPDFDAFPRISWWRWIPAHNFTSQHIALAQQSLQGLALFGEPRWFEAVRGDAAIAIATALRVRKRLGPRSLPMDIAMTALVCIAARGDIPTISFVASMLKERAKHEPRCDVLSTSWLSIGFSSKGN